MTLSIEPATERDFEEFDCIAVQAETFDVFKDYNHLYETYAFRSCGKLYCLAGLMELDGTYAWFYMDNNIYENPLALCRLILAAGQKMSEIYDKIFFVVDARKEDHLYFATRLGAKYIDKEGDYARFVWQTH